MIALIIQILFSMIMLNDALQRKVAIYWYLVILLPFGELVYFFKLVLRDPAFRRYRSGELKDGKNLVRAKRDFSMTPSLHNRRRLAEALWHTKAYDEALAILEPFAQQHADDLEFQVLFAKTLIATKSYERAIAILEPIVDKHPKTMDFDAWLFLIAAHAESGNQDQAMALMASLQESFPRMKHQLTMAAYLTKYGDAHGAHNVLKGALRTFDAFPAFLHWEHGFWAKEAKRMLRQKRPAPGNH